MLTLPADTTAYAALGRMRETRNQLAVVVHPEAVDRVLGLVTVADVLRPLFARPRSTT